MQHLVEVVSANPLVRVRLVLVDLKDCDVAPQVDLKDSRLRVDLEKACYVLEAVEGDHLVVHETSFERLQRGGVGGVELPSEELDLHVLLGCNFGLYLL